MRGNIDFQFHERDQKAKLEMEAITSEESVLDLLLNLLGIHERTIGVAWRGDCVIHYKGGDPTVFLASCEADTFRKGLLGTGCVVVTNIIYHQLKFSNSHEDMLRMSSRQTSVMWKKVVGVWGCQDKDPTSST